jgi:hypothetical protein
MSYYFRDRKRLCPVCGIEFEMTYGVKQVYCTPAHKQKAYRDRKALRSAAPQSVTLSHGRERT